MELYVLLLKDSLELVKGIGNFLNSLQKEIQPEAQPETN